MAAAIIGGLCAQDPAAGANIHLAEPIAESRDRLADHYGVQTFARGAEAIVGAETIILAVKPQIIPLVTEEIKAALKPNQLLISIAAGISCARIESLLGIRAAIVRAMPNTPALIGRGISGLYANNHCQAEQRTRAEDILSVVGKTIWIEEESLMDAVTAVSGSGPAYAFFLIEAMRDAGVEAGLDLEIATTLAANTVAGAGLLALTDAADITALRQRVTSPGGTTAAAMAVLHDENWDKILQKAVLRARDRGLQLAEEG